MCLGKPFQVNERLFDIVFMSFVRGNKNQMESTAQRCYYTNTFRNYGDCKPEGKFLDESCWHGLVSPTYPGQKMCVLVDLFHTTRCLTMYRFALHGPFHDLPWMNSFGVLCSKEKIHLGWCLLLWMLWRHASRVTSQDVHWDHGRLHFVLLSLCKDRSNTLLEQPHP